MITFAKRNLLVFFKDKSSVFFSLFAVFIIIGLYALFLGDMMAEQVAGLENGRFVMDSWISAGLIAITPVTSTMGALGAIIADKESKAEKDFRSSPIKNYQLVGGYLLSAIAVGFILSLIGLILCEIYIVAGGGELLGALALLKVTGLVALTSVASTCMMLFIVSFIKSLNAFSAVNVILGAFLGFMTGIYMPIGSLPDGVQAVVKCFPPSHAAALFRQVMMERSMEITFGSAPAEVLAEFKADMGVTNTFGGHTVAPWVSLLILVGTIVVFFALSVLVMSRKKKRT